MLRCIGCCSSFLRCWHLFSCCISRQAVILVLKLPTRSCDIHHVLLPLKKQVLEASFPSHDTPSRTPSDIPYSVKVVMPNFVSGCRTNRLP